MNQNIKLKALFKMLTDSLIIWAVVVLVFYFFVGSWGAVIPVGIIAIVARLTFFYSDFQKYKNEIKSKQSKNDSKA